MSNHYTYRAEWSAEDDEYVGLVAEFPSLSWLAPTAAEAVAGAVALVDDILADMAENGETPPAPLTERRYSGNLSFRTSPTQHRKLAIEAAEQGVSVNQLLIYKLAHKSAVPSTAAAGIPATIAEFANAFPAPVAEIQAAAAQRMIERMRDAFPAAAAASAMDRLLESPAMKEAMAANTETWFRSVSEAIQGSMTGHPAESAADKRNEHRVG